VLADVHIVLLRPRWASNLGAVARAMKNFGLQRLTLVDSRIGSWTDAWRLAVRAKDVLERATSCACLGDAIADATWVVGTTNAPPHGMRVLTPRELASAARTAGPLTLLFGGEQQGLFADELRRCHAAAVVATAADQPSLNLAQAVCVFAAELFAAAAAPEDAALGAPVTPPAAAGSGACAPAALMQRLEHALAALLADSAWNDATRPARAIAELMQPLWRARLTEPEVRAWLVALGKAGQAPRR
jgi:TrmH family RNA methyltransferase